MSTHTAYCRNVSLWPQPTGGTLAARHPEPSPAAVDAAPLLLALLGALGDEPSPCAGDAERWTSGKPDDVAVAVEGCAGCPAQRECRAYGLAIAATAGVWGGRHLGARAARRPSTTERERVSA